MNWDWGPCRPRHYCTGAENSCNTAVSCTGFPGGSSYYTGCKWYHSCPYDSWYWYGSDPCYRIRNTDKSTCDALAPFYVKGSCRPSDPNAPPRICHARTEYVVVKASESDDVRRLLGDIRPVVPNTRKSIRCFCALRFLIPALLYMYPLLCRGTLDKVRETLEKRANAMTDERDGDDPPLFDLAGWLTTELEEDLGAVFTMCANLTDSALFLVDEMRSWGVFDAGTSLAVNLMDPFTFAMEPGGHLYMTPNDGSDIRVAGKDWTRLDDRIELWARTVGRLCGRAAALNWTVPAAPTPAPTWAPTP